MKAAAAHCVHGMAGDAAARDWPALSLAELRPLFAEFPFLGPPLAVNWHSPRPFAASGLVRTARGELFVKRHSCRVRNAEDLAEEHAFLAHLRMRGANVPLVVRAGDGRTAMTLGDCVYEIHELAAGADLYRDAASWTPVDGLKHAESIGSALAELHEAALGFDAPPRRTHLLVADFSLFAGADPIAAIAARAAQFPILAEALAGRKWRQDVERVLMPYHAALLPLLSDATPLWTHNDLHASNMFWREDGGVASVVDFGLANRTFAMFDLATTIERNAIAWLDLAGGTEDIGRAALARAILRSYGGASDSVRHLLPLVHVDFALSELAYFHGVTGSRRNADRAYHDFLLGHALWFGSRCGRAFLDALHA